MGADLVRVRVRVRGRGRVRVRGWSCGERHCDCSDRKRRGMARDGTTRKRSLTWG